MDEMRSFGGDEDGDRDPALDDRPPSIGTDERRMHVRAYNFWVSLLGGRSYPSIADLEPGRSLDFGPHAVLLDFTRGEDDPAIVYLGDALRRECGVDRDLRTIADVPGGTVLSRLTDHYLQIIANRAPIGFEAEFVDRAGAATLYRGILMPFASDGDRIDYVYGVINWKTVAEHDIVDLASVIGLPPAPPPDTIWADGPSGILAGSGRSGEQTPSFADGLAAARAAAEEAEQAEIDWRGARLRMLDLAHDLGIEADRAPGEYALALRDAGIDAGDGDREAALVALVCGSLPPEQRADAEAALAAARRIGIVAGGFARHVEAQRGGLKALIAADRTSRADPSGTCERLRALPARARVALPEVVDAEFVLLLARRGAANMVEIVGTVPDESPAIEEAIRKIAC